MPFKVVVNIDKLLQREGISSLRELSRKTDIRHAALSELSNGKRKRIQFEHIEKIANEFNIRDINEIISLKEVDEDS
ncbi:helix-turn-helix transcriptional regulator [Fictibacillus sp. Mic-4]|uniref:helix-turn-helix domain-containing protein n=1 Tax=Fictibacillus sp. Mic-4 TaxID=3132826 RepID=UPI003CF16563